MLKIDPAKWASEISMLRSIADQLESGAVESLLILSAARAARNKILAACAEIEREVEEGREE